MINSAAPMTTTYWARELGTSDCSSKTANQDSVLGGGREQRWEQIVKPSFIISKCFEDFYSTKWHCCIPTRYPTNLLVSVLGNSPLILIQFGTKPSWAWEKTRSWISSTQAKGISPRGLFHSVAKKQSWKQESKDIEKDWGKKHTRS